MTTSELVPVWSCATSMLMCLPSAGPPAAPDREHVVRDVHARQLLVLSGGDTQWLTAAAVAARRRARKSARLLGGLALVRPRLGHGGNRRWRFALSALTRDSRTIVAAHWTAGAEIAEAAKALLAGAEDDPAVQSRILADAHRVLTQLNWSDLAGKPGQSNTVNADREGTVE